MLSGSVLAQRFAIAALLAVPATAVAQVDTDGDGVSDAIDEFPCDNTASGMAFAPAQGAFSLLLAEDQWVDKGDLDFNDLVLAHNYVMRTVADGSVTDLRLTLHVLANGGDFRNALGLGLPVPVGSVASVTRTMGGVTTTLTPSGADANLVVIALDDLRDVFGGALDQINSIPGDPTIQSQAIEVHIQFTSPVALNMSEAPFDIFLQKVGNPGHQIHRVMYAGTASMDNTLFNTGDDASSPGRTFVDTNGLPFMVEIPHVALYPSEATAISVAYPDILAWAASGGTTNQDWYTSTVNASATYSGGVSPGFASPTAFAADTSCLPAGTSCVQLLQQGNTSDGVYSIDPDGVSGPMAPVNVYCDQTTDGGGWTVVQRRQDGSVNFYRNWANYKAGFGSPNGELWLGLDIMRALTNQGPTEARFDFVNDGASVFEKYSTFGIGTESTNYRLTASGASGTAGDSFSYHSGMGFSTTDRDNDAYGGNCVARFLGPWWHRSCHYSNLNGEYGNNTYAAGVTWYHYSGYYNSMEFSEIKIRLK